MVEKRGQVRSTYGSSKNCHFETRKENERVLTLMRMDDYGERAGEIEGAVDRVEKKLGRAIRR